MKLRVTPADGWGWYDVRGIGPPSAFDLYIEIIEEGTPFKRALGRVAETGHPFSRLWISLSQRHTTFDGWCNLDAFAQRPSFPIANAEWIAGGMGIVEIIPD
jgi:hypothetical protein